MRYTWSCRPRYHGRILLDPYANLAGAILIQTLEDHKAVFGKNRKAIQDLAEFGAEEYDKTKHQEWLRQQRKLLAADLRTWGKEYIAWLGISSDTQVLKTVEYIERHGKAPPWSYRRRRYPRKFKRKGS